MKRVASGFTLIEILIVIAVVAILASIALPAYNEFVMRGKIPDATTELSKIRIAWEHQYQDNPGVGYAGATCPPANKNFKFTCGPAPDPADSTKTLSAAETYLVTADGLGSMTGFQYTINWQNAKTSATPKWGSSTNCWLTKKGSC